jgi:hypothetical protein
MIDHSQPSCGKEISLLTNNSGGLIGAPDEIVTRYYKVRKLTSEGGQCPVLENTGSLHCDPNVSSGDDFVRAS